MTILTQEVARRLIQEQGLDIVIPSVFTSIADYAFYGKGLTSVSIPNSILTIGDAAFSSNRLTTVDIPSSVKSINDSAFFKNNLRSVAIPGSVRSIGQSAFAYNDLRNVVLAEGITSIGDRAFGDNELTSIEIPDGVTYLSGFNNNNISTIDIPSSVTDIGKFAFFDNNLEAVYIPGSVTSIGYFAFGNNQLSTVDIPDSVISLSGFNGNRLTSVSIPNSVTSINSSAFSGNLLESADIPYGVTIIGADAFRGNLLTSAYIPGSVTTIEKGAFAQNRLQSVQIPDGIVSLSGFEDNELTTVAIPDSVTSIGDSAFRKNRLTSIDIPAGVTLIGDNAFSSNQLTHIGIPGTIASIGDFAFAFNALNFIDIPGGVESIGALAFAFNQLTNIDIPGSVKLIGVQAFLVNPLKSVSVSEGSYYDWSDYPDDIYFYTRMPPTDLRISELSFDENLSKDSAVATLSSIDPNLRDMHTYSLVTGRGDTHNRLFAVVGDELRIQISPDFETLNLFSIRVETADSGGLTFQSAFTLTVIDLNEVPTALNLSATSFQENIAPGSTIATLSTTDPDAGEYFSYALISGSDSTDNAFFSIDGNQLTINASPDFESKSFYSIRLQTTDSGGLTLEKEVTLDVSDIPEFLLPVSPTGSKVTIADTSSPEVFATSQSSPDLIEIKAPVTATLNALTTERYGIGLVARNVGTTTNEGTGQIIPLVGIGKYTFVATAIPEATTTINLEPTKDTAFFLHDAYSAFYTGLTLSTDSSGRQSHQRVLNVDTIFMGSGGGTSIVDLTSKDYVTGAVTVFGADKGRSIFWGTDAKDTYISRGGDSVIFGGAGSNSASLGIGRDILQYRAGVGAIDRIEGFDRTKDAVELWIGKDMVTIEPQFSSLNGSTLMQWGGNTVEFVSVPDLTLSNLKVISRIA